MQSHKKQKFNVIQNNQQQKPTDRRVNRLRTEEGNVDKRVNAPPITRRVPVEGRV